MRKKKSCRHMLKTAYPPTPALAKAGAAPRTTAGVELVFLSFKCLNASRQIRSACRLPPQPSLVGALHAQPRAQKPHGHINGFLPVKQATPRPHQWLLLGGPDCRSPGVTRFKPFKRLNILLACRVQACRLPGLIRLKGLKPLKLCKHFLERLGGPACRSPGVTRFKPFKRLNIRLACLIPQPTGTPRPHQWLLLGVQAGRLPALKRLIKRLKSRKAQPRRQKLPQGHIHGFFSAVQPAVRKALHASNFKPFKRLNILLACLLPQPTGTPRRHQWLLMGVQACRLPGLKRLKGLKGLKGLKPLKLQKVLGTPNRAGKSYPKATSMASSQRSSLPFARRYTLQTLQTLKHPLGMPTPAANRHPKATSMASYGCPSLPFARPSTLKRLKTLKALETLLGTPNRAGKSYPKATAMASSQRSSSKPAVCQPLNASKD